MRPTLGAWLSQGDKLRFTKQTGRKHDAKGRIAQSERGSVLERGIGGEATNEASASEKDKLAVSDAFIDGLHRSSQPTSNKLPRALLTCLLLLGVFCASAGCW